MTIGTGEQRVLVELRGADGTLTTVQGTPTATLRDENGAPQGTFPGELVWVVPETQPAYAFLVDFPGAGTYQLTVDGGDLGETPPAGVMAVAETIQVAAGESRRPPSMARGWPGLSCWCSPASIVALQSRVSR